MTEYGKKDLGLWLKQSRLAAMMLKIHEQREDYNSVVQASVEVTESSLLPDVVIIRTSVTRDRFN